jgi:hypothetical protein
MDKISMLMPQIDQEQVLLWRMYEAQPQGYVTQPSVTGNRSSDSCERWHSHPCVFL